MTTLPPNLDIQLKTEQFADFFKDIHGVEPFPWQVRLTRLVMENGAWPEVIDLPTGTGKTAVVDTAVFCLAAQPNVTPRRIVFVIDRRIVVDQVHERAKRIRDQINSAGTSILRIVKHRLNELSEGEPLGVSALRGGIPMQSEWTHRPEKPWILVSTVDQFGSRLLFRGYGVSTGMLPIHAALSGNDCLVVLDEVHLSRPFSETLHHIADRQFSRLPRRFHVVEMSATPSNQRAKRFKLDKELDIAECEELRRRVLARKRGQTKSVANRNSIPREALKIIKSMLRNRSNDKLVHTTGVILNRVRTARETFRTLNDAGIKAHLLTGRMRPLDKAAMLQCLGESLNPDTSKQPSEFQVVVSTQSIEVGADFSFDSMITECAPIDSLRQRFGRLDRRGRYLLRTGRPAEAWILGAKSEINSNTPDPIYGEAIKKTWTELNHRSDESYIDIGPASLEDFPDDALAPKHHAPLLLTSHIEAWVQTNPQPLVQPAIDWHLHGIDQHRVPEVSVAWRWDRSEEGLRLVPPRQAEFIQIPIKSVQRWLNNDDEEDMSDLSVHADSKNTRRDDQRVNPSAGNWVRWLGLGDGIHSANSTEDIRPGDVIVVDPAKGGLVDDNWCPQSDVEIKDLGDEAQIVSNHRATLRLDPRLPYISDPPLTHEETESDMTTIERIKTWIQNRDQSRDPPWMSQALGKLSLDFEIYSIEANENDPTFGYYTIAEKHKKSKKRLINAADLDGSDSAGSFTGSGVHLNDHLDGVGKRAADIAKRLGLPNEFIEDLQLAGKLHDLGKVDSRFQLQLVGGDPVELEMRHGQPLAKSLPQARRVRRYPKGMRHEVASVAMITSNSDVLVDANDPDLVLHLVGTHHGHSRPLPPVYEDPEPQILKYKVRSYELQISSDFVKSNIALDMADRFWRLIDRYGVYGLTWLEAILRLADHRQSEEESALQ